MVLSDKRGRRETAMKEFIRKNLMIVVSIALPLLVILFFALASIIPGIFATPPEYDLLLSLHDRATPKASQLKYDFVIRNGRLKVELSKKDANHYEGNPRLFLYQHESGETKEISLQIPQDPGDLTESKEIPVPEFADNKISDTLRAPDGYEFRGRSSGGGVMTELFGGRRNRTDVTIANGGAIIRVRLPTSDYWYNNVRFVGWVVE
jgi:hypothetical protein